MDAFVIEDEPVTRAALVDTLTWRGHSVAAYQTAEEAWLACQRRLPPLMLIDWLLPGMDGLELCRRVRTLPRGRSTVILVVTVRDRPGDLGAVLAAGADDYLAKPPRLDALAVRIAVAERRVEVVQERDRAEAAMREQTRLQGALLAAGSVQHYLGSQLSLTMGCAELLMKDARLHEALRGLAEEALSGVIAARETLAKLQEITRVETSSELGGPPVIDLERSTPRADEPTDGVG